MDSGAAIGSATDCGGTPLGGTDLSVWRLITASEYLYRLQASCLTGQQVMGEEDWFIDPHSSGKNTLIAVWTYIIKEMGYSSSECEREVKQDMKMIFEIHAIPVNKICIRQSLEVI